MFKRKVSSVMKSITVVVVAVAAGCSPSASCRLYAFVGGMSACPPACAWIVFLFCLVFLLNHSGFSGIDLTLEWCGPTSHQLVHTQFHRLCDNSAITFTLPFFSLFLSLFVSLFFLRGIARPVLGGL